MDNTSNDYAKVKFYKIEDILKEHIEHECYMLKNTEDRVTYLRESFKRTAGSIIEGKCDSYSMMRDDVVNLEMASAEYRQQYYDLSRLCHKLCGEYLEIFKRIVGERLDI